MEANTASVIIDFTLLLWKSGYTSSPLVNFFVASDNSFRYNTAPPAAIGTVNNFRRENSGSESVTEFFFFIGSKESASVMPIHRLMEKIQKHFSSILASSVVFVLFVTKFWADFVTQRRNNSQARATAGLQPDKQPSQLKFHPVLSPNIISRFHIFNGTTSTPLLLN